MTPFEFATATRIVFGNGVADQLAEIARSFGAHALVLTGASDRASSVIETLEQRGIAVTRHQVAGEPTTQMAEEAVLKATAAELVIAIGGGSVLDTGKAVAALLANGGAPLDYLEVIGAGKKITKPSLPFIAVPTTAGTGAEVTRNAVLLSEEHRLKVSLRSALMLPRVALVDPLLTQSMPKAVTASTGVDALTQVLEPFVSNKPNPMVDAICQEGMRRAARSLRRAYEVGDRGAREDMALTSLFGGMALANAKLGAVHGFAGPLGGMFHCPHGAVCARLLPLVMAKNVAALLERQPNSAALRRYDRVGQILTDNPTANAQDGIDWATSMIEALEIPSLSTYGLQESDCNLVAEKAARASSMKGNPITLTKAELLDILTEAG